MEDEEACETCVWYKPMTKESGICKKMKKVIQEWDTCEGHEEE